MNNKTVVVFAPHPDDEVIACGGSIIQHIRAGDKVHIVFSTDGRNSHSAVLDMQEDPTPLELLPIRQKEAKNCAKVLGVPEEQLYFLGVEDTQMEAQQEAYVEGLKKIFRSLPKIDVAYIPHNVREANIDHRLTGKLVLETLPEFGFEPEVKKYIVWTLETEKQVSFSNRGSSYTTDYELKDEVRIEVNIKDELAQKKEAFIKHETQVSVYSKSQDRAVLPDDFCVRVYNSDIEVFWMEA